MRINYQKIFYVNWFRKDQNGKFLWPGALVRTAVSLSGYLRELQEKGDAVKTPIGYMPTEDAIDLTGLDGVSDADLKELLKVDKAEWLNEVTSIREHYAKIW